VANPGALQAAEKLIRAVGRGFIPGITQAKSTQGFSPCGMLFGHFARNQAFFRSLFSPGLSALKIATQASKNSCLVSGTIRRGESCRKTPKRNRGFSD
jgi:hypothetical protein